MQGMAVGRAVDLTQFSSYKELLSKLEEMFDIKGELCGPTKKWQVVYTDDEDDMMMVGDDPWQLSSINHFPLLSLSLKIKKQTKNESFMGIMEIFFSPQVSLIVWNFINA